MKRLVLTLVASLIVAAPASAEDPARTFDELRRLAGPIVYVRDAAGQETRGRLLQITDTTVVLLADGATREIAQRDVARIDRRGDSLQNGAAIGAIVGLIAGAVMGGKYGGAQQAAAAAVVTSGTYAALGAGIDALYSGRTPLYRARASAPTPHVAATRRIVVTLRRTW